MNVQNTNSMLFVIGKALGYLYFYYFLKFNVVEFFIHTLAADGLQH